MALQFQPFPPPQQPAQEPNPGLQVVDRLSQMAQMFAAYKQQQTLNQLTREQRDVELAKASAENGQDFWDNLAKVRSQRGVTAPMAGAQAPAVAAAPAAAPAPAPNMPNMTPADPYAPIQDPYGPLPNMTPATPAQSLASVAPAPSPSGQAAAPAGPMTALDLTPEHMAEIRRQKGSKGLKEFQDTQNFLSGQQKDQASMTNMNLDNESKLRGDYSKASTNFKTVSENLQTIQSVAQKPPSAAGDISLIFSYMKLMDPNSTVREGEYATAANAAGVSDRLHALYNRLLNGEKLAPVQRADFINTSGSLYQGWLDKQKQTDDAFRGIATRSRVNPENVILPYGVPSFDRDALAKSPGATSGQAPATTTGGMVRVTAPDGTVGSIPRANLAKAISRGYKAAQ